MTAVGTKPIQNCSQGQKVYALLEDDKLTGEKKGDLASGFPHCGLFTGLPEGLGYLRLLGNPREFLYYCQLDCGHRTDRGKEAE